MLMREICLGRIFLVSKNLRNIMIRGMSFENGMTCYFKPEHQCENPLRTILLHGRHDEREIYTKDVLFCYHEDFYEYVIFKQRIFFIFLSVFMRYCLDPPYTSCQIDCHFSSPQLAMRINISWAEEGASGGELFIFIGLIRGSVGSSRT